MTNRRFHGEPRVSKAERLSAAASPLCRAAPDANISGLIARFTMVIAHDGDREAVMALSSLGAIEIRRVVGVRTSLYSTAFNGACSNVVITANRSAESHSQGDIHEAFLFARRLLIGAAYCTA
jgi:hypothetical protein